MWPLSAHLLRLPATECARTAVQACLALERRSVARNTLNGDFVLCALLVTVLLSEGCARTSPSASLDVDGSTTHDLFVRVPAALTIGRALDALSVTLDPAAFAPVDVKPDERMVLATETETFVFPRGQGRASGTKEIVLGSSFEGTRATRNVERDGIPTQGTKYVVEMNLVLFETPSNAASGPDASGAKVLWARTLRQSEE